MTKLYPPYIEGKLKAQNGNAIIISFKPGLAVGLADISGYSLQIKTISDKAVCNLRAQNSADENGKTPWEKKEIEFLMSKPLNSGQHYKVQLAFVDTINNVGYYSTVGVFKYIGTQISASVETIDPPFYIGKYSHEEDPLEKAYSYCFNLYKGSEIIDTSGFLIHNASEDIDSKSSQDYWLCTQNIDSGDYTIEYIVNTVNGLEVRTQKEIPPDFAVTDEIVAALRMSLIMENDYDNGCIRLKYSPRKNINLLQNGNVSAEYLITRDRYKDGVLISDAIVYLDSLPIYEEGHEFLFQDYEVEQGVRYRYALQQVGKSKISEKVYFVTNQYEVWEDSIQADFEDIFLSDGEKHLKIRFNPKVGSMKNVVLETKTDTIGGQYPFIFRNGDVKYREMQLSGLISHLTDDNELFINKWLLENVPESIKSDSPKLADLAWAIGEAGVALADDTNLTADNMHIERNFKNYVLSWLNDGKPKLMRTPAEGNFIVRLMNVSMTPNDTLGRMLHSCSATAYEVAEYNRVNLTTFGLVEDCISKKPSVIYSPVQRLPKEASTLWLLGPQKDLIKDLENQKTWSINGTSLHYHIKEWYKLFFTRKSVPAEEASKLDYTYTIKFKDSPVIVDTITDITDGKDLIQYYNKGTEIDFIAYGNGLWLGKPYGEESEKIPPQYTYYITQYN